MKRLVLRPNTHLRAAQRHFLSAARFGPSPGREPSRPPDCLSQMEEQWSVGFAGNEG